MTDIIERATRLQDGIAPGPWTYNLNMEVLQPHIEDKQISGSECVAVCKVCPTSKHLDNARFIAASRQLVPDLIAEVIRLRAEITRRDEADRINNRNSTQKGPRE
jgi:hypothetical protein